MWYWGNWLFEEELVFHKFNVLLNYYNDEKEVDNITLWWGWDVSWVIGVWENLFFF